MNRTTPPPTLWYFAYGANMSARVLTRRSVHPLAQQPAMIKDPSWVLAFRHRAGFATLLHSNSSQVHSTDLDIPQPYGVLYTITNADLTSLQRAEVGYRLVSVPCITADDKQQHTAYTFTTAPFNLLPASVPPRQAYLHTLLEGATAAGLPEEYVARLRALPTAVVDGYGLPSVYYDTPQNKLATVAVVTAALVLGALVVYGCC